jgi:hypothetical protein
MSKRKYMRLLSCNLINKKVKFHRSKTEDNDILFRFEYEGSYLTEYYMNFKDAVLVVKVNNGNLIYKNSNVMVYSLADQILCIITS